MGLVKDSPGPCDGGRMLRSLAVFWLLVSWAPPQPSLIRKCKLCDDMMRCVPAQPRSRCATVQSPIGGNHPVSQVWDHTLLHTSSVSVNIDWVKKKSSIKVFLRLTEVLSGGGVLVARVRRVAKTLPGQILSLPGSFWQQTSV